MRKKKKRKKNGAGYPIFHEHQDAEIHLPGEAVWPKESEDIHITGIYVGGECRTGCGSHPHSAEPVEELEESVWSVVRQENVSEDQGEGVQNSGTTSTGVRAETWALKKAQEKKLEVAELRMLRRMYGVAKLDKIINERIRGTTEVWEITKKVQERRLKWYGHVIRREEHYTVGRRDLMAMKMKAPMRRKMDGQSKG